MHEHAVVCPHCGEPTGVTPDPAWSGDEVAAAVALGRIQNDTYAPPIVGDPYNTQGLVAAVGLGVAAVGKLVDTIAESRDTPVELPRAIARVTPPEVTPVPSRSPDPPPPPTDTPRFLK